MKKVRTIHRRVNDPFDDSAIERQRRMGLLCSDGAVNTDAIAALGQVFAGLFLDNLCDSYTDIEPVAITCQTVINLANTAEARRTLLELCARYDAMRRTLPEPIWWIVGNNDLLTPFIQSFALHLSKLTEELEVMT